MTKPNTNVDTPISTASLSGTLILGASQLIKDFVPTDYQAVCNVLIPTAITYVAIHSTRRVQAYMHKRQVDNYQKDIALVIEGSIKELRDIISTSEGDVKKHAQKNLDDLLRYKIDIISGKHNILALHEYVTPHPMQNTKSEPKTAA